MNEICGDSYDAAYRHFKAQHRDSANLLWHVLCLFFQLFSNFAFLAAIENHVLNIFGLTVTTPLGLAMRTFRSISLLSSIIWILELLIPRKPIDCPLIGKVISIACILAAYSHGYAFSGQDLEKALVVGFIIVWILTFRKDRGLNLKGKGTSLALIVVVVKIGVYYGIMNSPWKGSLAPHSAIIIPVFVSGLVLISFKHDPVVAVVAYGALGGHILSALLDDSLLFLFCSAFTGTLFQGLAHAVSGEEGTLVVLQNSRDEYSKIAYEWSHVVFFPNILLHACLQKVHLIKTD
jgi:hypothetical protein